ncbi:hypothetical protein [Streptomyces sp. H27-C3]|nr:hypothetical protein [Streptomyces sp. H27-C3]MDJ0464395.1 hypothetical protein [Streptomyces sp. H27-C3]
MSVIASAGQSVAASSSRSSRSSRAGEQPGAAVDVERESVGAVAA